MVHRAIIVGIDDYLEFPLTGCVNDANALAEYLTGTHWHSTSSDSPEQSIDVITDESATFARIVAALERAASDATAGDIFYFHFSGHGDVVRGEEVLCPIEFLADGLAITPSILRNIFSTFRTGVRITWSTDSCQAGDFFRANSVSRRSRTMNGRKARAQQAELPLASGNIDERALYLSPCLTNENAVEVDFGRPHGAFTYYLLHELRVFRALRERQSEGLEQCGPTRNADALIARVRSDVDVFCMQPSIAGPAEMRVEAFLNPTDGA